MSKAFKFAVMGAPITHSLSPTIHKQFSKSLDHAINYDKIETNHQQFKDALKQFIEQGGNGLNLTLPLKEIALDHMDELDDSAKHAKAINTISIVNGKTKGFNTDGVGFLQAIEPYINLNNKDILIIGAGGAAAGILSSLLNKQINSITITNRTHDRAQKLINRFEPVLQSLQIKPTLESKESNELNKSFDLVINATSASLINELFEGIFELLMISLYLVIVYGMIK